MAFYTQTNLAIVCLILLTCVFSVLVFANVETVTMTPSSSVYPLYKGLCKGLCKGHLLSYNSVQTHTIEKQSVCRRNKVCYTGSVVMGTKFNVSDQASISISDTDNLDSGHISTWLRNLVCVCLYRFVSANQLIESDSTLLQHIFVL